jgi:hypothetical protein
MTAGFVEARVEFELRFGEPTTASFQFESE